MNNFNSDFKHEAVAKKIKNITILALLLNITNIRTFFYVSVKESLYLASSYLNN